MKQNIYIRILITACVILIIAACSKTLKTAELPADHIRLNQIGFYPDLPKIAVVKGETEEGGLFYVTSLNYEDTFQVKPLGIKLKSSYSEGTTRIADFSEIDQPGQYYLSVPEIGVSYPITINKAVHKELLKASLKGFYFQRASTDLPSVYAGDWARKEGHPDNKVVVHASAATDQRPEGTVISATKGWYDAGDYNKYIVNSGITMGTLLALYEDFPEYFTGFDLQIPESGNPLPDLLNEILWNLRWMLTMQDPYDGGVYHKLTNPEFDGMVMPADATDDFRYVVQKSTAASLDFAAVMAQSARVYKNFQEELPGLADSCMTAALKAWEWSLENPEVYYDQNDVNEKFRPHINTGAYGDKSLDDEFIWAALELWISTQDRTLIKKINIFPDHELQLPSWSSVQSLGYYSLVRNRRFLLQDHVELFSDISGIVSKAEGQIIELADKLLSDIESNPYRVVMGGRLNDFIWGSNAVAANQGIALIQAYMITGDEKYFEHAVGNLDYLLGRNATGYSFVTGYGAKPAKYPHHRPSEASDFEGNPVPGLLVGGPNAKAPQQDNCDYNSLYPGETYSDSECSFASNEIAINWNAPLVYLVGAIEALQSQ